MLLKWFPGHMFTMYSAVEHYPEFAVNYRVLAACDIAVHYVHYVHHDVGVRYRVLAACDVAVL